LVVGFIAVGRALRLSALGPIAALTLAVSAPIVVEMIGQGPCRTCQVPPR
jgi:hypothetical protein